MSCPVCFGGDDILVRESLNTGIGVMMGVTAIVLACFARFFIGLARRARQTEAWHAPLAGSPLQK
jgi:hypothetical protein